METYIWLYVIGPHLATSYRPYRAYPELSALIGPHAGDERIASQRAWGNSAALGVSQATLRQTFLNCIYFA